LHRQNIPSAFTLSIRCKFHSCMTQLSFIPTKNIRPAAVGSEQIRPQSVATTSRQTRAMTRRELPGTSAANNRLASTNRKRNRTLMSMTHLNQDRFKAMLTKLDDWKICTSVPKDNLMMLTYDMLPAKKFLLIISVLHAIRMPDAKIW